MMEGYCILESKTETFFISLQQPLRERLLAYFFTSY